MIKSLIEELAYDKITLSQGLTRAKIIAFKIENSTFQNWLKKELEGYADEDPIPDYRKIKCIVKITVSNGYREQTLPLSFDNMQEIKEMVTTHNAVGSIAGLEENYFLLGSSDTGCIEFEPGLVKLIQDTFKVKERYNMHVIKAGQEINKLQLKNIIDLTKQKLIDTLLQLDKEFPDLNNNFKMSEDKSKKVQNIITNNIYGSNNPLNVATGQTVEQKDFTFNLASDFSQLEKLGVEKEQIVELENIVKENKNDQTTLKSKTMKWLGSVSASVAARGLYDQIPAITDFIHNHIIK